MRYTSGIGVVHFLFFPYSSVINWFWSPLLNRAVKRVVSSTTVSGDLQSIANWICSYLDSVFTFLRLPTRQTVKCFLINPTLLKRALIPFYRAAYRAPYAMDSWCQLDLIKTKTWLFYQEFAFEKEAEPQDGALPNLKSWILICIWMSQCLNRNVVVLGLFNASVPPQRCVKAVFLDSKYHIIPPRNRGEEFFFFFF